MIRLSRIATLVVAATLAGGAVACSRQAPGQALPASGSARTTPHSTQAPTTTSRGKDESLDRVNPCALLTVTEISQFGAKAGEPQGSPSDRACDWGIPGGHGGFQIVLRNSEGLRQIVVGLGKIADQQVGSRKGKILKENVNPGSCMVSFEVTDSSRVDVQSTARSTPGACDYSMRVATLIEPRLPKGE